MFSNAGSKEKLKEMDPEKTLNRTAVEVINTCTGAKITMPEEGTVIKVTTISNKAFANCTYLISIIITESVIYIADDAFLSY